MTSSEGALSSSNRKQPAKKRKKEVKNEEAWIQRGFHSKLAMQTAEYMEQYRYPAICQAEPALLQSPDFGWRARVQDEKHVKTLIQSFQKAGTVNEDILVAVVDSEVSKLIQKAKKNGTDPPPVNLCLAGEDGKRPQVVSGDHSVEALRRLHAQYPFGDCWATARFKLIVVPDTAHTKRMLLNISNIHNKKHLDVKKQEFSEVVEQIHRQVYGENENRADTYQTTDADRLVTLKRDLGEVFEVNPAQMGQWFQVAKVKGELWKLLKKVMNAEYDHFKPKVLTKSGKVSKVKDKRVFSQLPT